jgi:hypothetical protein
LLITAPSAKGISFLNLLLSISIKIKKSSKKLLKLKQYLWVSNFCKFEFKTLVTAY